MKKIIQPLHDRVVIEPMLAENTSAGGIIIPDTAKEKPNKGTIIANGNGIKGEPMTVKKGDIVLYAKHAGQQIEIEGKSYLIMKEADIIAII